MDQEIKSESTYLTTYKVETTNLPCTTLQQLNLTK